MKKYLFLLFSLLLIILGTVFSGAKNCSAAILSLSPATSSCPVGGSLNLELILDTQGLSTQGVGIRYLNYNPSLVSVEDKDTSQAGIQMAPGSLYSRTQINSVNQSGGRIEFVQLTQVDEVFNGKGTLARLTFRALTDGIANITFDFTTGSTTDTNVAFNGQDILSSVVNGSYVLGRGDTVPPGEVSNLSVQIGGTQITLKWQNPADADFAGLTILRKLTAYPSSFSDGTKIYEGRGTAFTDTGLLGGQIYYYAIFTYDAAGNYSQGRGIAAVPQASIDAVSPVISDVRVEDLDGTKAKITWQTNESANSKLLYGKTTSLELKEISIDSLVTSHGISLSRLSPSTRYYFVAESQDSSGNISQSSQYSFITLSKDESQKEKQRRIAELRARIAEITAEIARLRTELAQILSQQQQQPTKIPSGFRFQNNLWYGMRNIEVAYLQLFLKAQGADIYPEAKITGFFGSLTKKAVMNFQLKYAKDILLPLAMRYATGIVGPSSRAKINQMLY